MTQLLISVFTDQSLPIYSKKWQTSHSSLLQLSLSPLSLSNACQQINSIRFSFLLIPLHSLQSSLLRSRSLFLDNTMAQQCCYVTELQQADDEEVEEEEAPSLSDLPLTGTDEHSNDRRRSMSEPADFFEFMMPDLNCSSYTFSWNDLPWPSISSTVDEEQDLFVTPKQSPPRSISLLLSPSSVVSPPRCIKTRRSESFNESKFAAQYSSLLKSPCFRPSRSLDYCRLRRNPSSTGSVRTISGGDSSDRANPSNSSARAQPRSLPWYWLMFGPLRVPPAAEIELRRSGKSRQNRPPATLFPAAEKVSGDRRGWKLISVLSCKSHASVAVTTPFQPFY